MMLEIKLADICMFEEIYEVLKGFKNPRINMDDWKNLLTYHWRTPDENPGFVLLDDGRVVGYIGTIFSKRHVNGKIEKNCNLTSWIVKDKYRKESLKLLLHILKLKDYNLINLTPSQTVRLIMEKFGFEQIDYNIDVLLPFPGFKTGKIKFTQNEDLIKSIVNQQDLKYYEDHKQYKCIFLLGYNDTSYSFIILTKRHKKHMNFSHIHYISNKEFFIDNIDGFRLKIIKSTHNLFTFIDSRFLKNYKIPRSYNLKRKEPKYFKTTGLQMEEIDNLYTEYILLNV